MNLAKSLGKEDIVCDFCGSDNYSNYAAVDGWKIVKCTGCGFHYTNPRPLLTELPKFYSEAYFNDERHSKKFYNEDGSVKSVIEDYSNRIETIENNVNSRGRLLEVGAARGGFLKVMQERGWSVAGVEISEDAVGLAKSINNLDLFCGELQDFNPIEKFDVICMYQTLEHVANPKKNIAQSFELLANGGVLIVEVPNIKGYDIRRDEKRRHLVYDLPRHLNHFSPKFLSKQMSKMGFEVVLLDRYYPQFVLDLLNRKSTSKKHTPTNQLDGKSTDRKEIPLKRTKKSWKLKIIDSVSIFFPGWRFTIVAKKNSIV